MIDLTTEPPEDFAADAGLHTDFLAGCMSMFLNHERIGVEMWQLLSDTTTNPMLKGEYKRMKQESVAEVQAYEAAITELGGDTDFVSDSAKATMTMDRKLLEAVTELDDIEPVSLDSATVAAAGVGAMACVLNVDTLASFADEAKPGRSKDALKRCHDVVGPLSHQHHEWALTMQVKMATMVAKHETSSKVLSTAEGLLGKVQDKLS